MPKSAQLLQQDDSHVWMYFPSAILLGALHRLEWGHSKTMMAAFIVAIRGSVSRPLPRSYLTQPWMDRTEPLRRLFSV